MNSDLEKLNNWLKLNHLTLSISKSKFMIIGSSQRLNKIDSISFKIDNMDLDEVSSFKYLGIVIRQCLSKGRGRGGRAPPPVFFLKSKNRPV